MSTIILQLRVYTASNVREELEVAKREFLQSNVEVKKSRKVFLPKILERFARESSLSSDDLLKWVTENVDKKLHDSIQKCMDCKSSKKASQIIEWLPYSSRFQYVLSMELTDRQWWVWDSFWKCLKKSFNFISSTWPLTISQLRELVACHTDQVSITCQLTSSLGYFKVIATYCTSIDLYHFLVLESKKTLTFCETTMINLIVYCFICVCVCLYIWKCYKP